MLSYGQAGGQAGEGGGTPAQTADIQVDCCPSSASDSESLPHRRPGAWGGQRVAPGTAWGSVVETLPNPGSLTLESRVFRKARTQCCRERDVHLPRDVAGEEAEVRLWFCKMKKTVFF